MKIERIILRHIRLPLVHFFETSFGRTFEKEALLVETIGEEFSGWGECVAGEGPFYSYEDVETAWSILTRLILLPTVEENLREPERFGSRFAFVRGHPMAKASVEASLWDWKAKRCGMPLWRLLGGVRQRIPCGVSIGIQDTPRQLLQKIAGELEAGYRKVKIKIKPGWDVDIVKLVRKTFPDIPLMVDANSAYTLADAAHLKKLDDFNLMMIEQPLSYDDLIDHSRLQGELKTAICLDESIRHSRDAAHACSLKACRIINIKSGRLGGIEEARRVHDVCRSNGIPVWCGGMLETGIGRAHNIALSTLPNFSIPGDVSASRRYFERDTVQPPIEVSSDGFITAPSSPGIGFEPDVGWIEKNTVRKAEFSA